MESLNIFLENRVQWRSELSFIIVTAGAVIGIGNFWLFPTLINQYGSGFVLVYLACLLLVGIPAMMAEMLIGRQGRQNQVSTMQLLAIEANRTQRWKWLGFWGAATLLLILTFYTVISSFSLAYFYQFISGNFHHLPSSAVTEKWHVFLAHPKTLLFWNTITILLGVIIIARGIRHGLETLSYITVFGIFILLFVFIGAAIKEHLFLQNLAQFLTFNARALAPAGLLAALGYAFFSISIGGGTMLVYGSYLPQTASLTRSILWIVFLELLSSILTCLALNPWVFNNLSGSSDGLGLLFEAIPQNITLLKYATIEGSIFYLVVFLAAWTSIIAFMEPLAIILIERFHISRIASAVLIGVIAWIIGLGTILSFNLWQTSHWSFYQWISILSMDLMLPLGGLGFCLFAGYGMTKKSTSLELNAVRFYWIYTFWRVFVRYVAPLGIFVILLANIVKLF